MLCDFCNRSREEAGALLESPKKEGHVTYICFDCADRALTNLRAQMDCRDVTIPTPEALVADRRQAKFANIQQGKNSILQKLREDYIPGGEIEMFGNVICPAINGQHAEDAEALQIVICDFEKNGWRVTKRSTGSNRINKYAFSSIKDEEHRGN